MNENNGFIKLHRKILKWEWYSNINTRLLFLHLLIAANWEDTKYKNRTIKRGQLCTTVKELATNNQQTIQQTRTALSNLQSTNEITIETTPQFSIITVVNYDLYQANNKPNNTQITNNQQTTQQTSVAQNNKPTLLYKEIRNKEHKNNAPKMSSEYIDSVVSDYNSVCISLPKVEMVEYKHAALISSAVSIIGEMSFRELFQKVEQSDFLSGRSGNSNWKCSFEWILRPENLSKILAGNYDNKQPKQQERIYNAEDLFA